jgi:site-specific DNA recombinase
VNDSPRCAVYARYSNEKQNPFTIDQQIRKCKDYADKHGLKILDNHIYFDEAISGATDNRQGLQRLLAAAKLKVCPFDVLLSDDTSRISRRPADSHRIFDELKFAGVRVVFVSQGIDSANEQAETMLGFHGLVDSIYLKDLSRRTFRGVEDRARKGLHTGGRVFGYKHVSIESDELDCHGRPLIVGVRLEVDEEQASTVRTIFQRYAGGESMKRIAIYLNDKGIKSPQPQKGRVSRSWCPSSVRHILLNERYRGIVIWGRTAKVRSPETGNRVSRRKPEMEWRRKEISEQRIVSDELWNSVQERFHIVRSMNGKTTKCGRAMASPYLFTGLLECSECHGKVTIVSGTRKGRPDRRYGCSMHASRGNKVCTNDLLVSQPALERQILGGLQASVLNPAAVNYALKNFEQGLLRAIENRDSETSLLDRRIEELDTKIHNCTAAIAEGRPFKSLLEQVGLLEAEMEQAKSERENIRPEGLIARLRDTRRFVEANLCNLRELLSGEVRMARAELAKHIQRIVLTRQGKAYVAAGNWSLLGLGYYDGAGGQNRTGYARLFRAALYQ